MQLASRRPTAAISVTCKHEVQYLQY